MVEIAELIKKNKFIEDLNLTGNKIKTPKQFNHLQDALFDNISILKIEVDVDRSIYAFEEFSEDSVKVLKRSILKNNFIANLIKTKKWTRLTLKNSSILDISNTDDVPNNLDSCWKFFRL
jgi:hypothetical protein